MRRGSTNFWGRADRSPEAAGRSCRLELRCRRRRVQGGAHGHRRQRGVAVDPGNCPAGRAAVAIDARIVGPAAPPGAALRPTKPIRDLMAAGTCLGGRSQITCCAAGGRRLDACPCQRQCESPKNRGHTAHANLRLAGIAVQEAVEPSFAGGEKYRELPQGAEAQTLLSPHLFDQERSYEDVMGTKECWVLATTNAQRAPASTPPSSIRH